MQNRKAVLVFLFLFVAICLYQVSFTWIVNKVEKKALEQSNGDEEKYDEYLADLGKIWLSYDYTKCKQKEMHLGLDLKGGMNVTLEVSIVDLLKSLSGNSSDITFTTAIQKTIDKRPSTPKKFIDLFSKSFAEESDGSTTLASVMYNESLIDKIEYESTDEVVINMIREEYDGAIKRTFDVLRARIDRFGVSQPNIQKLSSGRILVELPGVKDPTRARKLLQGTAKLEFWETYEYIELASNLNDANIYIGENIDKFQDNKESSEIEIEDDSVITDDLSLILDTVLLDNISSNLDSISSESDSLLPLYEVLFPNIDQNGQPRAGPVVGIAELKDTSRVNLYLNDQGFIDEFPERIKFAWSNKYFTQGEKDYIHLIALKGDESNFSAVLGGEVITSANPATDNFGAPTVVDMTMNPDGMTKWSKITKNNIGRCVAVVLDGFVYSFPTVQSQISGGRSQISGLSDNNESQDLANILKSGQLNTKLRITQEEIVGPSLGKESIDAGLKSFAIALCIVLIYMILYYSWGGIVANIALLANMFFIMGVLTSLDAVLTLPGIAGIVLTIGIAVDANVLIYERIREELLIGKGIRQAVKDGYNNAYSAIIDANVTTLLTAIILYSFGSGPVKGFATTLVIGILTSLFSAIFITRLIITYVLNKNKKISFYNRVTKTAFKNTKINFLSKRKIGYIVSSLIIIVGIYSMVTRDVAFNLGIDFKGGRSYVVKFDQEVEDETKDIRNELASVFTNDKGIKFSPEVKTFGEKNQIKVTTSYLIEDTTQFASEKVESLLNQGLEKYLSNNNISSFEITNRQQVGMTMTSGIQKAALISILLSLIVIFIYILIRFKNWQYSLGAVVAVFHDILFVLCIFSIFYGKLPFSLEINQAFIAALLTIIGYSLNDTVVVFDRIREYFNASTSNNYGKDLVNSALNSTLSRTINTSLTTFFVLLIIFILGGEVIRGFMFALLVGVLVGTYSSLFIATPVMFDTINSKKNR